MRRTLKAGRGEPWNETKGWRERRAAIADRVKRQQDAAHKRAVERKEKDKNK